MPARYLAIRDRFIEEGVPEQEAKSMAASMYNETRKHDEAPLTPDYDEKHPYKAPRKASKMKPTG